MLISVVYSYFLFSRYPRDVNYCFYFTFINLFVMLNKKIFFTKKIVWKKKIEKVEELTQQNYESRPYRTHGSFSFCLPFRFGTIAAMIIMHVYTFLYMTMRARERESAQCLQ